MADNLNKGSRKHILDWIDSPNFVSELNSSLTTFNVKLVDKNTLYPKSRNLSEEITLPVFLDKQSQFTVKYDFQEWWAPMGGKLPTWDMISLCKINDKDGVLLVEAKAHEGEFDFNPKKIDIDASIGSLKNHINIGKQIDFACRALTASCQENFTISVFTHYQLSNRFVWAWKLASLGIPVCLVYLGFIGDSDWHDKFIDEIDWNKKLENYLSGIVPKGFSGTKIDNTDFIFCKIARKID